MAQQNVNNNIFKSLLNNRILSQTKMFVMLLVLFLICAILMLTYIFKNNKIKIEQKIKTKMSASLGLLSTFGNNMVFTYFLDKNDKLIVKSKTFKSNYDNNNVIEDCFIISQKIRNKRYSGPTEIAYFNNNTFDIPKNITLRSGKNYIIFEELQGTMNDEIKSNKNFKIHDEDLYLSGDNITIKQQDKYAEITKKPHLIIDNDYKNNKNDKTYSIKKSTNYYDIRAKIFEVFGLDGIFIAKNNVILTNKDLVSKSDFLEASFDQQNKELKHILLSKNVMITQKDNQIFAYYGFFDKKSEYIIFYKNVFIKSKNTNTKNDMYIYNPKKESGITFNKYTLLTKKEQNEIYALLNTMQQHLPKKEQKYINFLINENKSYISRYYSNNHSQNTIEKNEDLAIDRSKKVKVHISND